MTTGIGFNIAPFQFLDKDSIVSSAIAFTPMFRLTQLFETGYTLNASLLSYFRYGAGSGALSHRKGIGLAAGLGVEYYYFLGGGGSATFPVVGAEIGFPVSGTLYKVSLVKSLMDAKYSFGSNPNYEYTFSSLIITINYCLR